jgi:hypothetical protein
MRKVRRKPSNSNVVALILLSAVETPVSESLFWPREVVIYLGKNFSKPP